MAEAIYRDVYVDLVWGEHGITRNELVHRHWAWRDNIVGLNAVNDFVETLIDRDGWQENPHVHIIAAIVAERLE